MLSCQSNSHLSLITSPWGASVLVSCQGGRSGSSLLCLSKPCMPYLSRRALSWESESYQYLVAAFCWQICCRRHLNRRINNTAPSPEQNIYKDPGRIKKPFSIFPYTCQKIILEEHGWYPGHVYLMDLFSKQYGVTEELVWPGPFYVVCHLESFWGSIRDLVGGETYNCLVLEVSH